MSAFVPEADIAAHSIISSASARIDVGKHNSQTLCCFQIDNKLELCRQFGWQFSGFGAVQYLGYER